MKKLLLLMIGFCALSTLSNAQSLEGEDPVDFISDGVDVDWIDVHWNVINTSDQTLFVRLKREIISITDGTQEQFCWGPLCYNFGTDESSSSDALLVEIGPSEADTSFHGRFDPNGLESSAVIEYCFFDHNNESDESCYQVEYVATGTSNIAEVSGTLGNMGPNPVTNVSSFNYSFLGSGSQSSLKIYNMVGAIVKEIPLNSNTGMAFVSASDFEAGVYFYSLTVADQVVSTKKFIVSK